MDQNNLTIIFEMTETSGHFQSEFKIQEVIGRTHFCLYGPSCVSHLYFVLLISELAGRNASKLFIPGPIFVIGQNET